MARVIRQIDARPAGFPAEIEPGLSRRLAHLNSYLAAIRRQLCERDSTRRAVADLAELGLDGAKISPAGARFKNRPLDGRLSGRPVSEGELSGPEWTAWAEFSQAQAARRRIAEREAVLTEIQRALRDPEAGRRYLAFLCERGLGDG
ncbi:MAG: hypothetical protein JXJ18_11350 [Rhodobacteraceae bacterium]|nr:hypothetical protein [Paracoccaceae bacterium]